MSGHHTPAHDQRLRAERLTPHRRGLSPEQKAKLRRIHREEGLTVKALAQRFGVSLHVAKAAIAEEG